MESVLQKEIIGPHRSSVRRHLVLPVTLAVSYKQATLLLADVVPDPLLDQGVAGAALERGRGRQAVRQAGPR